MALGRSRRELKITIEANVAEQPEKSYIELKMALEFEELPENLGTEKVGESALD